MGVHNFGCQHFIFYFYVFVKPSIDQKDKHVTLLSYIKNLLPSVNCDVQTEYHIDLIILGQCPIYFKYFVLLNFNIFSLYSSFSVSLQKMLPCFLGQSTINADMFRGLILPIDLVF